MGRILFLLLISIAPSLQAADAEPVGARAFVDQIIALEVRGDITDMRNEAYLALFTPRFRSAIAKDMAGPELNVIDSDFLCECQVSVEKMRILAISGAKSSAIVRIESWSGVNPPVRLSWHLQREGQSWRISDVETSQRPSLLAELERSNRLH